MQSPEAGPRLADAARRLGWLQPSELVAGWGKSLEGGEGAPSRGHCGTAGWRRDGAVNPGVDCFLHIGVLKSDRGPLS